MTKRMNDNLPGSLNDAVDFMTRAHSDNSGLASAVSEYMGKEGAVGIPEVRRRAHEAGLDDLLQGWRDAISKTPAREADVKTLFPPAVLSKFAEETGLSPDAVITGLASVVPGIVYRNAKQAQQKQKPSVM
ncbi:hypothetical protein AA0242T_1303 [Acetobacter aceti NRIC 0242]|uniref:DUF937 domain-containing protein n=1 Tax=Acetobacter aceti NBRC 14818 TaxID=887700 RepID=A0AB33IEZ9_ACEAC|nr:YidB family protein [Acetobacter aceti]TCS27394.1 hypothetical protein EDC15_12623 [Acetobacter aceti NBRC 14818]BCK76740.1 hypothetical protein EMQ_2346 [Acetobacter aceti NBRC 14818]GAN58643.1 hypothetical protein Abac_062_003 [Acetobacter aceti NBRC 14818]GBO80601.1 hypothetical protein AA0242T_1303 [Acetobacter aceti NRIC 0242]